MSSSIFKFKEWTETLILSDSCREEVVNWLVENRLDEELLLRRLKRDDMKKNWELGIKFALELAIEKLQMNDLVSSTSSFSVSEENKRSQQVVFQQKPDNVASSLALALALEENERLRQQLALKDRHNSIVGSLSKSHIRVYNDNESKMRIQDVDIVFNNKDDISDIAKRLWDELPVNLATPRTKTEIEHQSFFEKVLDWTIKALGTSCQLRFEAQVQLGVQPDVGIFSAKDITSTWDTLLVPCEVEVAMDKEDSKRRKEGIGQALSYTSHKFVKNIERQKFVYGLFTTSWHIEIFKQIIYPEYQIIMTGLLPFIPSPRPVDVTSGFCAFIRLLTMTPIQLGNPTPFLQFIQLRSGGRIDIRSRLGTGGFSDVYAATINEDDVAIKSLHDSATKVEMYTHEYDILSELQDPGCDSIPKLHDQCSRGKELILTPVGMSLKEFMRTYRGKIEVDESIFIINRVLSALKVSHAKNIKHLDLRIENVIVTLDNMKNIVKVVVIDWGLAINGEKHLKGISGTLSSAATEICTAFENDTFWIPKPEHDLESVLYLYVALREGEYVWSNELRTSISGMINAREGYVNNRCKTEAHLALFRQKLIESKLNDNSIYYDWINTTTTTTTNDGK